MVETELCNGSSEETDNECRTAMIDVWLHPSPECNIKEMRQSALLAIEELLQERNASLVLYSQHSFPLGHIYLFISKTDASHAVVSFHSSGLVTITIEEFCYTTTITNQILENMRRELQKKIDDQLLRINATCDTRAIPTIKRGTLIPNYYTTCDERILELDFEKIILETESDYQHIRILRSPTLGNCLMLDNLQNLSEADLNYTRGLMDYGNVCYKDKEILILGGGDGGLLNELLKEQPRFVTLVDIDEVVVQSCREHLRGACGSVLDSYSGKNYQIIIDDCLKQLDEYIAQGRTFDCVFSDLTDIPINVETTGEPWDFAKQILQLGLKVLRKGGLFTNQTVGATCPAAIGAYEQVLRELPVKIEFTKRKAFVPSFMEEWVFFTIKKLH